MKRLSHSCFLFLVSICFFTSFTNQSSEEAQIRKNVASYLEAFRQQNPKALAAHWAEDAEYTNPLGHTIKGRDAIEREFSRMLTDMGKVDIDVTIDSIEFERSDRAIEIGSVLVTKEGETPTESSYQAVHVKVGDQWLLKKVSESDPDAIPTHYEALKDLEWMIGTWGDEKDDIKFEAVCSWDEHKNFMTHTFTVSVSGQKELEGNLIIGWDPAKQKIRSWMFDSDGGFGEGTWKRDGNRWIVYSSSILPDGRKGSSINIYKYIDQNTITWESVNRIVGGELLPNVDAVKVTRKMGGVS